VISLFLLPGFRMGQPDYQFVEYANWIGNAIHYHIGIDGLSLFLVLLTTFLTPLAILCSWTSIHENVKGFFIAILVIETAMIGVFVSLDLFLFFLFWELTLIPMYFMIGIWGHDRRIYAAVKFILYTMFGSILMLVAILWLYNLSNQHGTGTFDVPLLQAQLQHGIISLPPTTELLLFCAFFLAFAIKVPLFPFHTWLPDAHTEAPTAGSVILAGVMLKLGTYGIMRFCLPLFPYAAHRLAHIIGVLALIGIIYGALVATIQPNFKRLIAYTSVSHLGFVILGIFSFTTISFQGAIFQMISHGVSTGGLFLGLGMIYDRRHTYEIKEFGGLANPMPIIMSFYLFIALSSLALPPLNGFIGEFLILIGVFQFHHFWAAFASSGAVLSAIYLLWSYQRVALGEVTVEKNRTLSDASGRERLILVTIAVAILFMGLASPLFTRRMEATTDNLARQTQIEGAPQDAKVQAPARVVLPIGPELPAAVSAGADVSAGNSLAPAAPTHAHLVTARTEAQVNP
jgi:NADH-quinone oxidoreductase subunit M